MIVRRLRLVNFRGFEQIELDFEEDVNVIAGVNGLGKSSILQALAALFSRALPEIAVSRTRPVPFINEDVHHGKLSLDVSAIFTGNYRLACRWR
jgi:predicted ATP-dependent endonuclease of OLD family